MPRGADRLNLLAAVAGILRQHGVPFVVIGAAAMAVRGVSRSTRDLDVLAVSPRCLEADLWAPLRAAGVSMIVRAGDAEDPLAGVVRFTTPGASPVDLIVGRSRWQHDIVARGEPAVVEQTDVPVATAADLVLLKLYAAGPQDAWDVVQLLEATEPAARTALVAAVEAGLGQLPEEAGRLWRRVQRETGPP